MNRPPIYVLLTISLLWGFGCAQKKEAKAEVKEPAQKKLSFERRIIIDSITHLWSRDPKDITGDGIADLVVVENSPYGGPLAYYIGQTEKGNWQRVVINDQAEFSMGDLETYDMDGDGDQDIVAAQHTGEWEDANAESEVFWYENPEWEAHRIGNAPDFIKDVSIEDFDGDGRPDVAVLTFEESSLRVYQQKGESWELVLDKKNYKNLHEGMHTGDLNGDGFPDIVAEAHVFYSPGKNLSQEWQEETIDEKWNNQEGDWSRNGTKIFVRDLDGDQKAEVFVSHSERTGYPLVYYQKKENGWQEHVLIDSIAACHTIQVFDFDLDGYYDVLTGVNKTRASDLGLTEYPVFILKGSEGYNNWETITIAEDGIYNGQAVDYDADGDMDIIKYQTHDATEVVLMQNGIISEK